MNILREQSVVKTNNKFSKLPLGSVTARGWLKDQLLRNKDGMGGHLDELEPDGYLGSFAPDNDRTVDYNPWSASWCYRALLSFYEATERQDVLDTVHRACLWFCENWKDHKTDYAGPYIIEPMIVTYAYTGDERLVKFSNDWLEWLENNSKWQNKISQYLSDSLPYSSMHAVAYGEEAKHPALVYCATGEERLLRASVKALEKALQNIVQLTGGPSSCGEQLSPKGGINETEYCNFATYNTSYSWMALITGESRWGDEIERCIFNGAQGARKKDERAIAYFTSPNQLYANRHSSVYGAQTEYGVYAPCFSVACCPTQSVRIIPEFIRGMGLTDENRDLYLLCYGPAEVKAPKLDFTMDTLYPFRDTITLTITRSENAVLNLRIPAWCKTPEVTVNGKNVNLIYDGNGYARIDAILATKDVVVLHFPMEVTLTKVDDSASGSKFPICIERGPLVYALPIPTIWTEYPGNPVTPLPEGWCWYEASPNPDDPLFQELFIAKDTLPKFRVIDETLTPDQIRVVEHKLSGYVWENPPITLEVPLYLSKENRMFISPRLNEPWKYLLEVEGEAKMCTLIPHGCTNLRITYLPRAATQEI